MFEGIGLAGIALLWHYTLQEGQINHWVSRLICRIKFGVWMSVDDTESNILGVVRSWPWLKAMGYCPVCFGFWLSIILTLFGVIMWYQIGLVFLSIKLYSYAEDVALHYLDSKH
jgi:hypothetical protein